jgi:hypothetical protein
MSKPRIRHRLRQGSGLCQCPGCLEYFYSTAAFDKHRTGRHGLDRRCRTPAEMMQCNMARNRHGFWVGDPNVYHTAKRA